MGSPSQSTSRRLQEDIDKLDSAGITVAGTAEIAAAQVDVLSWLDELGIGVANEDVANDAETKVPVRRRVA